MVQHLVVDVPTQYAIMEYGNQNFLGVTKVLLMIIRIIRNSLNVFLHLWFIYIVFLRIMQVHINVQF